MMRFESLLWSVVLSVIVWGTTNAQSEDWCCDSIDFLSMTVEPEDVSPLSTMVDLSMQVPKLTTIPDAIRQAKGLVYLNVSFNRVGTLPEWLMELKSLHCLDLSGNHFLYSSHLPSFLGEMHQLKVIKLCDLGWSGEERKAVEKKFPNIQFIFEEKQEEVVLY